jgi:GxxExxY protein
MNVSQDNQLSKVIIGTAIDVHRQLGPDLDEVAYEEALSRKLAQQGVENRRQVPLPLIYKGVRLDCGYRLDILVEERLPLELKAVVETLGVHEAQLLTYQRAGDFPLGLLINFNVPVLKQGIHRSVETRAWAPPDSTSADIDSLKAFDPISAAIVLAAIEVHRHIGPGMLASSYLACLCHELTTRQIRFEKEKQLPLLLDGEPLIAHAEVPLLIEGEVPVLSISAESITPLHVSTALARLRQGGWRQGLILNFNSTTMLGGLKRVVL